MAATRGALTLLALLRAAAGEAAGSGARHFTVTSPPRNDRFLGVKATTKYHPIAVGGHHCEEKEMTSAIESEADCAAAAQILWPEGLQAPCLFPVWADNIVVVDKPHEPFGCLTLQNFEHGCGLHWNPTGQKQSCVEPGLTCNVVCWKPEEEVVEIESEIDGVNITVDGNITIDEDITIEGSNASSTDGS